MKYIKRLLTLPFMLCIHIIAMILNIFRFVYLYMKHGGEIITYLTEHEPKRIKHIYDELIKQKEL